MKDVSPSNATIKVIGDFGSFTPQELFDYWVKPELLVQWWPREAMVDPKVGGSYKFSWPDQNWHLQGTYTAFEPGKLLGFTWSWDHDRTKNAPLLVDVSFDAIEGGAHLTLDHGPWEDTEAAQAERQGVIEGWIHFGMRLAGLRSGTAD